MQIGPISLEKPGNAGYLALVGCAYAFVASESVYKPRTLSLVGEGMVSTVKTNRQYRNNLKKVVLIIKTQ